MLRTSTSSTCPSARSAKVGGLFLFLPYLAKIPLDKMLADAKGRTCDSLTAGDEVVRQRSAQMSYVFDEGFFTEYSCRIRPVCYPQRLGLKRGRSLDLDFHTIPFHRRKGVLAFVAQDSETRVFCEQ